MLIILLTAITVIPYGWSDRSVLDILLYPFNTLLDTDAISQAFTITSLVLPLLFGLLIQRKLVNPLSEDKMSNQRTFKSLFTTGLIFVMFPVVLGIELAHIYGLQILFFYLPLSLGMLIVGVFSIRITGKRFKSYFRFRNDDVFISKSKNSRVARLR